MICSNGHYVSGSYCKLCGEILLDKPKKRPGIAKVSEKRKKLLEEYKIKRKAFLEQYPFCAMFPMLKATDIHHSAGKEGDALYLDENYWVPLSRKAHRIIEDNPSKAKELGFSVSRLKTNKE